MHHVDLGAGYHAGATGPRRSSARELHDCRPAVARHEHSTVGAVALHPGSGRVLRPGPDLGQRPRGARAHRGRPGLAHRQIDGEGAARGARGATAGSPARQARPSAERRRG